MATLERVHNELEKMVAVLHDVVEDTPVTLEDLKREGFFPEVVQAIDALTKCPKETRLEAARETLHKSPTHVLAHACRVRQHPGLCSKLISA